MHRREGIWRPGLGQMGGTPLGPSWILYVVRRCTGKKAFFVNGGGTPPLDQVGYYFWLGDVPEKKAFGVPEKKGILDTIRG